MRDVNQILYQGILTLSFQKVAVLIPPHSCTVHLDTIKVLYLPTDAQ